MRRPKGSGTPKLSFSATEHAGTTKRRRRRGAAAASIHLNASGGSIPLRCLAQPRKPHIAWFQLSLRPTRVVLCGSGKAITSLSVDVEVMDPRLRQPATPLRS